MKNTHQILFVVVLFLASLNSCTDSKTKCFPFSESELTENNMFGALLEYAIYDSSKIEFVEKAICDSIKKNQELMFCKTDASIVRENSFNSYFFFDCNEAVISRNDYIGFIYFNISKPDSLILYCDKFRYSTEDIDYVVDEIVKANNSTIEETVKHHKFNDQYVPNFYFTVFFGTMDCNDGFVKKAVSWHNKINGLMDSYSERHFKNEKIKIRPYIEIRVTFANKDA
jgi:hypothetical protein